MSAETKEERKTVTTIVNGREKTVTKKELSFAEIVKLAFENPPFGDNTAYTVTYRKGEDGKAGSVVEGGTVKVKDGTIFNVSATDKS